MENPTFLDDKLLKICEEFEINTDENIQELYKKVITECSNYCTGKLTYKPMYTNKEVKSILDRTFNLFDNFVRRLYKSTNPKLKALHELFSEYTFKKEFLKKPELNEIYYEL